MTQAEVYGCLAMLNRSLDVLREIAALPEQTEMSVMRAIAAAHSANDACNRLDAAIQAADLFARLREAA